MVSPNPGVAGSLVPPSSPPAQSPPAPTAVPWPVGLQHGSPTLRPDPLRVFPAPARTVQRITRTCMHTHIACGYPAQIRSIYIGWIYWLALPESTLVVPGIQKSLSKYLLHK